MSLTHSIKPTLKLLAKKKLILDVDKLKGYNELSIFFDRLPFLRFVYDCLRSLFLFCSNVENVSRYFCRSNETCSIDFELEKFEKCLRIPILSPKLQIFNILCSKFRKISVPNYNFENMYCIR